MRIRAAMLAALAAVAAPGLAQGDPRLQIVPYRAEAVVPVRVVPGFVATVVLNPDERVASVAVGNTAAWDVTPSKSGDRLFVRPLATGVATNVEVVTDTRQYSFLLQSTFDGDPQAAFRLAFDYPRDVPAPPAPAAAGPARAVSLPGRYRLGGDRLARPLTVADDGTQTQFVFAEAASLPAIYAIDDQGHETLVTTRPSGDAWVIDRVWPRYVLRVGHATAEARRLPQRSGR